MSKSESRGVAAPQSRGSCTAARWPGGRHTPALPRPPLSHSAAGETERARASREVARPVGCLQPNPKSKCEFGPGLCASDRERRDSLPPQDKEEGASCGPQADAGPAGSLSRSRCPGGRPRDGPCRQGLSEEPVSRGNAPHIHTHTHTGAAGRDHLPPYSLGVATHGDCHPADMARHRRARFWLASLRCRGTGRTLPVAGSHARPEGLQHERPPGPPPPGRRRRAGGTRRVLPSPWRDGPPRTGRARCRFSAGRRCPSQGPSRGHSRCPSPSPSRGRSRGPSPCPSRCPSPCPSRCPTRGRARPGP